MKTERRHELQQNLLADWLGSQIEQVKPYWQAIVGTILVAATVYVAFSYFGSMNRRQASGAWEEYFNALSQGDGEALGEIAADNAGSAAGFWAMQSQADIHLALGTRALFRDRDQAREELAKARSVYTNLLHQLDKRSDPLLAQRAMFGLAQTHEALGSLVKAVQQYEELADDFPDSAFGKAAKERKEHLETASVHEFCSWFAKQTPRPAQRTPPTVTDRGGRPRTPFDDLPDSPDLSLPSEGDLEHEDDPLKALLKGLNAPDDATTDDATADDATADDATADDATEEAAEEMPENAGEDAGEDSAAAAAEDATAKTDEESDKSTVEEAADSTGEADNGDSAESAVESP